jgi:uncharacterized membrane protein
MSDLKCLTIPSEILLTDRSGDEKIIISYILFRSNLPKEFTMSQSDICNQLHFPQCKVSRVLKGLVKEGILKKGIREGKRGYIPFTINKSKLLSLFNMA